MVFHGLPDGIDGRRGHVAPPTLKVQVVGHGAPWLQRGGPPPGIPEKSKVTAKFLVQTGDVRGPGGAVRRVESSTGCQGKALMDSRQPSELRTNRQDAGREFRAKVKAGDIVDATIDRVRIVGQMKDPASSSDQDKTRPFSTGKPVRPSSRPDGRPAEERDARWRRRAAGAQGQRAGGRVGGLFIRRAGARDDGAVS
jgi:hypothetical protein